MVRNKAEYISTNASPISSEFIILSKYHQFGSRCKLLAPNQLHYFEINVCIQTKPAITSWQVTSFYETQKNFDIAVEDQEENLKEIPSYENYN